MKWLNLKNNRCPKCNKDFARGLVTTPGGKINDMILGDMRDTMFHHPCGFMITEQRYKEIVSGQIIKNLKNLV